MARHLEHGIQNPCIADAAMPQLKFDHQSAFFFKWQWLGHFAETPGGEVGPGHNSGQNTLPLDIPVALIIALRLASVQRFFCAGRP